MTSFCFSKRFLCFEIRVTVTVRVRDKVRIRVKIRVRVRGNTFKFVFGQTSIRASVLDLTLTNYFFL